MFAFVVICLSPGRNWRLLNSGILNIWRNMKTVTWEISAASFLLQAVRSTTNTSIPVAHSSRRQHHSELAQSSPGAKTFTTMVYLIWYCLFHQKLNKAFIDFYRSYKSGWFGLIFIAQTLVHISYPGDLVKQAGMGSVALDSLEEKNDLTFLCNVSYADISCFTGNSGRRFHARRRR